MNEETLTSYERVKLARLPERININEYIEALFDDFFELHGDRLYKDDPSIVGGIGMFNGIPVTIIGHKKGRTTEDNINCNFGMTSPEGYRKTYRLMLQAEKFKRPVICFVDTPGAYPGIEAESNGQSNAIAENLALMSRLKVPTITIITGEGSSGGALALAVSDRVLMLENAVYSILSPEGFATIMWKDSKRAEEAADVMKLTAKELKAYGLIDEIVPEGRRTIAFINKYLEETLAVLLKVKSKTLVEERYKKFREIDRLYDK